MDTALLSGYKHLAARIGEATDAGHPTDGAFLVPPKFARYIKILEAYWRRREAKKFRRWQHQKRKQ